MNVSGFSFARDALEREAMMLSLDAAGLIALGVVSLALVIGGTLLLRRRRFTIVDYPELPGPGDDTKS